ncbi:hypothetical protein ABT381_17085 [Streptomyces sp. NPDC000151]|uniref:hypothetical protein n=1 Tax=Streptomyces sp. NPDC000151 TaxID=3154244 RepID=UPI0033341BBD
MVVQDRRSGTAVAVATAAGLALGAGLLTSGCTTDGAAADDVPAGPVPSVALRQSADALVRGGTSQVRTALETTSGGTRVAIRGGGHYDYRRGTGRLRLVLPEPAGPDGRVRKPITEIFAPGALYMKNRGAGVPADKWVRVDTTALSDGNLVTGGATDPLAAAELLRGTRRATYEGEERLRGVRVRHYRGTADIGVAADAASKGTKPSLTAAERGFTTDAVPFEAYLDEAGRLRKLQYRFSFANGSPRGTEVTSTLTFAGFGTKAPVELPRRADIYTGRIAAAGGG